MTEQEKIVKRHLSNMLNLHALEIRNGIYDRYFDSLLNTYPQILSGKVWEGKITDRPHRAINYSDEKDRNTVVQYFRREIKQ